VDSDQADTTSRSRKRYQQSAILDIEGRPGGRCASLVAPARESCSPATGAARPAAPVRDA